MGMPQIPEGTNRPNYNELIIDLLESVALDHMSVSHLLNAQGEFLQEIINKWCCNEVSSNEVLKSMTTVNSILNDTIIKEWMMIKRMDMITELKDKQTPVTPCVPKPPC